MIDHDSQFNPVVSLVMAVQNPDTLIDGSVSTCLAALQEGQWAGEVAEVRVLAGVAADALATATAQPDNTDLADAAKAASAKYDSAKRQLPAFMFGGRFNYADTDGLAEASQLVHLDLDGLTPAQATEVRDAIGALPYVVGAWLSPAHGVKVLARVPDGAITGPESYKTAWQQVADAVAEAVGAEVDGQAKDIARKCFVSCDPDLRANMNAVPFDLDQSEMPTEPQPSSTPTPDTATAPAATEVVKCAGQQQEEISIVLDAGHPLRSAIKQLRPAANYNAWLGQLKRLKAAGFDADEVESWSATGSKARVGEVADKWAGLAPKETPLKAQRALINEARKAGWRPDYPELTMTNNSDAGAAEWFLAVNADKVVWVADTAQMLVVTPTGVLTDDKARLEALMMEAASVKFREVGVFRAGAGLDNQEAAAIAKAAYRHCQQLHNRGSINAALAMVGAVVAGGKAPPELVVCQAADLNADLGVMGTPDGVFDIAGLRMLSADEGREKLVTASIPDSLDLRATHPFADALFTGSPEAEWLLDQLAYDATHLPDRHLVAMLSEGGSGKTTLKNAMRYAFGRQYATEVRAESLQNAKHGQDSTSHNDDLFKFEAPARWVYAPEMTKPNPRTVNMMSGGESTLTARGINQKPRDFRPTGTLYLQGNYAPDGSPTLNIGTSGGGDQAAALKDRTRLLDMPRVSEERKLTGLKEAGSHDLRFRQAVVAKVLNRASQLASTTTPPQPTEAMSEKLEEVALAEQPDWYAFLNEVFVKRTSPDEPRALSSEAWKRFDRWYEAYLGPRGKPTQAAFTRALKARYGKDAKRAKGIWHWPDLALAPIADAVEEGSE